MSDPPQLSDLEGVFENFLPALLGLGGIILFVVLLAGGFKLMTSGGNPQSAAQARSMITYAIFGLLLAASAVLILTIINYITGADVTNFSILHNP